MKILVVEDDEKIASFIKKGLIEEGFVVESSNDGKEALYLIETNHYDLILLDIMLPSMNGTLLCKNIRSKDQMVFFWKPGMFAIA